MDCKTIVVWGKNGSGNSAIVLLALILTQITGGMEFMNNKIIGLVKKAVEKVNGMIIKTNSVLANESGDQFTGFLIMVLLVVVVGAAFLILYQNSITDIWNGVINKIKSTFGI